MADQVTYRVAGHEDYKAVMDIYTDVYEGVDYLPALYHTFLHDKHVIMMLAEVNGKVISFVILHRGPTEDSVLGMAARTSPDYQNKGLITKLTQVVHQEKMIQYPKVKKIYKVSTSGDGNEGPSLGESVVLKQNVYLGAVQPYILKDMIKTVKVNQYYSNTDVLTIDKAKRLDLVELLPPQVFLGGSYGHMFESNKDELLKEIRQHRSLVTLDDSGRALAFSYVCTLPVKLGIYSNMHYHGEVNPEILKMHILKNCEAILDVLNTERYIICVNFRDIPAGGIKEYCTNILAFQYQTVFAGKCMVRVQDIF